MHWTIMAAFIHRIQRQVQHFWAESLSTGLTGELKKVATVRIPANTHTCTPQLPTFPCLSSMVFKGYKRPLVQEDMWKLNEVDCTAHINERFQHFMTSELAAARVRFKNKSKKKQDENRDKSREEVLQNGLSNGLGKGVSQDVLMMVRVCREKHLTHMYSTFPCTQNGFYF